MLAAVMEPYDEDGGGGFFRDVVWELSSTCSISLTGNGSGLSKNWCSLEVSPYYEELSAAYVLALGVRQGTIRLLKSLANDELDGQHQQSAAFLLGKAFKDWKDLYNTFVVGHAFVRIGKLIWPERRLDMRLEELIRIHTSASCSDPHDHVYGLLNLASDVDGRSPFKVDYGSRPLDLLIDTILWCRSKDTLSLSMELLHSLGLDPSTEECSKDPAHPIAWGESFTNDWNACKLESLTTMVTIRLEGLRVSAPSSFVDFQIRNDIGSSGGLIFLRCKFEEDRFMLANVEDTGNPFLLGRNSQMLKTGFLNSASSPRSDQAEKDSEAYFMELPLADLLLILTVEVTNGNLDFGRTDPYLVSIHQKLESYFAWEDFNESDSDISEEERSQRRQQRLVDQEYLFPQPHRRRWLLQHATLRVNSNSTSEAKGQCIRLVRRFMFSRKARVVKRRAPGLSTVEQIYKMR
ncbi:hypothetical protein LTR40_002827 [Exophiala xenobiotica]|nr:hypothetical protein LTR40_002827 [Exophiala xenobiotica]